jgi:hypothetical protein
MKLSTLTASLVLVLAVSSFQSCTNLDEELYDTIAETNFFQTEEEFVAALGAAYAGLRGYAFQDDRFWNANEHSTDECIAPTRGADWGDGGRWIRLHQHSWSASDDDFNAAWNFLYRGVNNCNRLIFQFETTDVEVDGKENIVAELRGLRAFYYFWLLDMFGNVPVVTSFDVEEGFQPEQTPRADVFTFVESELQASLDLLNEENSSITYGRFNKWAAYAVLARLYLNAEVYTGTARWADCVAACDQIINSDLFSLEGNYFSNFAVENEGSRENIFVVPYDENFGPNLRFHLQTLHYLNQETFRLQETPWNGFCTLADFYNSYDDDDERKETWLVGQQFSNTGEPLEENNEQLVIVPEISSIEDAARNEGARFKKFEFEAGINQDMSNDFPVFRYADILLTKAEALVRDNKPGDAVDLYKLVRERAGLNADNGGEWGVADLTEDNMLAERGRELAWEVSRRQDLIRFGKWNDQWQFKDATPGQEYLSLFPIPQPQIDANSKLEQNDGY